MKFYKLLVLSLFLFSFTSYISLNSLFSQTTKRVLLSEEFSGKNILYPCVSYDNSKVVLVIHENNLYKLFEANITINDSMMIFSGFKELRFNGLEYSENLMIKDPAYNHNANTIYFSANLPDSKGDMDIYYAKRKGKKWSAPENIGTPINTEKSEESPSVSSDNNKLVFARKINNDDYKNQDCYRIYFSKRGMNSEWQEPVSLPSTLNTGCVAYPYFSLDNKTLFFSSIRDEGIGGFDIYTSKMLVENDWNYPVPLQFVNTEENELSPSISTNENVLLYTQHFEVKRQDIVKPYTSYLPSDKAIGKTFHIQGVVTKVADGTPIDATLIIRDRENMQEITDFNCDQNTGAYSIILPYGKIYEIEVFKKEYSHVYFTFDTRVSKENEIQKDFALYHTSNLILNIFDEEIFEPLDSRIQIKNDQDITLPEENITYMEGGRIIAKLTIGYKYDIAIEKENYEPFEFQFDLSGVVQFNEFEKDVELIPKKEQFEINIADIETDSVLDEVEIVITNLEKNEKIVKKVKRDENGKFVVDLREGDQYEINVNGPKGYAYYNTKVDMKSDNKKLDVKLQPLKAKTKLELKDITYETNSAELNASSFEELNRVVKLLKNNPEIKIEISAHTDDVGSSRYNLKLSERRAQSVVNYLISNELPMDRLIAKGYGETSPLVANNSEENRARNRRVELKIVDVSEEEKN